MEEELESCPYNPLHTIKRSKMLYHIVRCRRSLPAHLSVCEYDMHHLIHKEKMEDHYRNCPAKRQAMVEYEETKKVGCLALPRPPSPPQIEMDEDWGEEADRCNRASYDPQLAIEQRMVLRSLPDSTRGQRKEFQHAEIPSPHAETPSSDRVSKLQENMEKNIYDDIDPSSCGTSVASNRGSTR